MNMSEGRQTGMMVQNQLTQQEARSLFEYRDGMLYWRHRASGRRTDMRAVRSGDDRGRINIGGVNFLAKYLVWNWFHGITDRAIRCSDGNPLNLAIDNLEQAEPFTRPIKAPEKTRCPCCSQPVPVPTPETVSFNSGLTPLQDKILQAVWAGRGMPVPTERIFDRMYEDDPDGGPTPTKMYEAFKVALSRMRGKLQGSGLSIVNEGYRRGYRIVIGDAKAGE